MRKLAHRRRPLRFSEHMAAWQIRRELGEDIWSRYFTFTVVRNPYDRLVSRFFHRRTYGELDTDFELWDPQSFDQFIRYKAELINENWGLYTVKDRPIVDFCVRYEQLEADLAEVSKRIGLGSNVYDDMKTINSKTGIRPQRTHHSRIIEPRFRQIIAALCAAEIEQFGYRFEPEPETAGAV